MQEIWSRKIGRWTYYVLYSAQTTKWMLCRRHDDARDDDLVVQGVSQRKRPSVANIIDEICDELDAIKEGMR